ncbi:MAG: hypothetical protein V3T72_18925 [Thermoanaerobaculia bacterium]
MSLEEKLAKIRAGAVDRIPADQRAVMHRVTDDLRASGIVDRAVKPGASLPPFALPNVADEEVRSHDLLARGPLVVTAYRGVW